MHASDYDALFLGCEEGTLVRILAACILSIREQSRASGLMPRPFDMRFSTF